jgi:GNAT superfamily N-acetyltransferase
MEIVKATEDDAAVILALQKLAYLSEAELYDDYTIEPLVQTLEKIRGDFSDKIVLKAVEEGRIVGSVRGGIVEGTCYVGKLIVHPDYQNRGLGMALMMELERESGSAARFELFTGWKSVKNLHLYGKLGYRHFKTKDINENLKLIFLEKSAAV